MGFTLGTFGATNSTYWSQFTPSGNGGLGVDGYSAVALLTTTLIVHVSNGGNDTTGTGSSTAPYATISKAQSILHSRYSGSGSPDWVLLDCNGTWTGADAGSWIGSIAGLNANERWLLSSYDPNGGQPNVPNPGTGGRQPLVQTSAANPGVFGLGSFTAVVDIDFYSYQRDINTGAYSPGGNNPDGIICNFGIKDVLIEGCRVRYYKMGVNYAATSLGIDPAASQNFIVRSTTVEYGWATDGSINEGVGVQSQFPGAILEDVIAIHNGYQESGARDARNRNYYLSESLEVGLNYPMLTRGCLSARDSSGSQQRQGGTWDNNLTLRGDYSNLGIWESQTNAMTNNVSLELEHFQADSGFTFPSSGQGRMYKGHVSVNGNIFAHEIDPAGGAVNCGAGMFVDSLQNNIVYLWCAASPSSAITTITGSINDLTVNTAGSSYDHPGSGVARFHSDNYQFTITSAAIFEGDVYSNNGVNYTVGTPAASPGTALIATGYGPPQSSGTLTKQSGSGPGSYTFSAAAEIGQYVFDLTSASPWELAVYEDSVTHAQFTMSINCQNQLRAYAGLGTGKASDSGTLNKLSGPSGSPASVTFSKCRRIHYNIPLTGGSGNGLAVCTAYANMNGTIGDVDLWNWTFDDPKSQNHNETGYALNDVLTPTTAFGGGTSFTCKVNPVATQALGTNKLDAVGTNVTYNFPDPNRSAGSYYARLPGATPNQTFTASISAGVLTAASGSPVLSEGDAITWSGQTRQDLIKESLGLNVYVLASNQNTSNKSNAASQTMRSYNSDQLVAAMAAAASKNTVSSGLLRVASVNDYIREGFGVEFVGSAYADQAGGPPQVLMPQICL